jgi:hypothetical protein
VRYRWAIGTTRWGRDVLDWVDFEGTNSTEEVEVGAWGVAGWLQGRRCPRGLLIHACSLRSLSATFYSCRCCCMSTAGCPSCCPLLPADF